MKLAESMIAQGVLLGFFIGILADEKPPVVVANVGPIEGYYKTSNNSRRYEAYEGISYAQPPVGELRFEPPKFNGFVSTSQTPLTAKKLSSVCMQFNEAEKKVIGTEDCLYLNIYRPVITGIKDNLLPVIFYIHGNDFQSGSGGEHGPKYLMDRDVILVTFNYRLGALGFLSTEDDVVPGNMGLKDQVSALRWVKYNIKHFDGDPENIAIFGHGAGGASVHYHYLTNQTEGLFRKGMSLSGTALAPWAQAKESRKKAIQLSQIVSCPAAEMRAMVECLKEKPANSIVQSITEYRKYQKSPFAPFGPVAEKVEHIHEFPFITELPSDIITSSRAQNLSWITGFVESDGLAVASGFIGNSAELENVADQWTRIAPYLLEYRDIIREKELDRISSLVKDHYLGEWPIAPKSTIRILNMITDRLFATDGAEAALLQAQSGKGPIRFYKFSYRGNNSFSTITTGNTEFYGASHKDDLAYVFDLPEIDMSVTGAGRTMRHKMLDLWVSYAEDKYHSVPKIGLEWPSLKENSNEMVYPNIIKPDEIVEEASSNIGERNFWGSLGLGNNFNVVSL